MEFPTNPSLPPPPRRCFPARWVAYHALVAVLRRDEDDAMDALRKRSIAAGLTDADRRLAAAIVHQVLRHLLTIDYQIRQHLRSKQAKLEFAAEQLLRMIVAQCHYLDRIPAYAALSDAVEMARALGLRAPTVAFINAVGRRLSEQKELLYPAQLDSEADWSIRWSQPVWITRRFRSLFGDKAAGQLFAHLNEQARIAVRVNVLRTHVEQLAATWDEAGIRFAPSRWLPECLVLEGPSDLAKALAHPAYEQGLFYVQDEASQLVAHFVAPQAGERILDLCAAPGGKTTHLAELGGGAVQIDATDRNPERLATLRANLERLGSPGVQIIPFDAVLAAAQEGGGYDALLLDAPCSALGTIRRHPEVRWRFHPNSLKKIVAQQRDLLQLAARLVRPGGRIVYATCSPLPEENEAVIRDFLQEHAEFEPASPEIAVPPEMLCHENVYYTWPQMPELDGFGIAVLRRTQ